MHSKSHLSLLTGESLVCGARRFQVTEIVSGIATVSTTIVKGDNIEIKAPAKRDAPWVDESPRTGPTATVPLYLPIGHKLRIGGIIQFRILKANDIGQLDIAVITPSDEPPTVEK